MVDLSTRASSHTNRTNPLRRQGESIHAVSQGGISKPGHCVLPWSNELHRRCVRTSPPPLRHRLITKFTLVGFVLNFLVKAQPTPYITKLVHRAHVRAGPHVRMVECHIASESARERKMTLSMKHIRVILLCVWRS